MPSAGEGIRRRFSTWLLRPFVDLGPFVSGPLYARAIQEYWLAFVDAQREEFALQRTLPPAFRVHLIAETGRPEYGVSDPRHLPSTLRTERWQVVCDALEGWTDLPVGRQCRLVKLLHSLCLYEPVLTLVSAADARALRGKGDGVKIAYWRASANYARGMPNRASDYIGADMSVFEAIPLERPDSVPEAFNSVLKVFVHKVKIGAPLSDLEKWGDRLARALADTASRVTTEFMRELLTSRCHRALAFLPQRHGDRAAVVRRMDLAERHALAMNPATEAQQLLYLENLHPLMESRSKEALWLGDQELALSRALRVVELDPYDPKSWVELGELHMRRKEWGRAADAYLVAGMLGPPASAVGRHMAGLCFRELGHDLLAAFFFKEALELDPLGISPRNEIRALPDAAVLRALKEWNRRSAAL